MRFVSFYRKPISLYLMVTFTILVCFWANQAPAAPLAGKNSPATLEQGKNGDSNFFEQEGENESTVTKSKKFPWLLVTAGVVVVAGLIVLLTKKKSQTSDSNYANGVLTVNGVRYELVVIPAGEFQMGDNSSGALFETPVHTVRISKSFWLGKTEVTQELWQVVMGSNPSFIKYGGTYPVEMVSWNDCQVFITKLNQLTGGNSFRLPTEAEWEYACRAGTTGDRYGDVGSIAWYKNNSGNSTHPVGQKQANSWGLYDILGNVKEWCQDRWGYYQSGYQIDPTGPSNGSARTIRGGSWAYSSNGVRSAHRECDEPGNLGSALGLRLAASSAGN